MEKFTLLAGRALTNELHKKAEEQVEDKKEAGDKKKKNKKKKWCFHSLIYPTRWPSGNLAKDKGLSKIYLYK